MEWLFAELGVVIVTPLDAAVVTDDDIRELLYFGFDPLHLELMEDALRRRPRDDDGTQGRPACPQAMVGLDELWSFLSATKWDEGTARMPGSVTLFRDQGRVKAAFNDRDADEVGFLALDESRPLLQQLDEALRSDRIDWRRKQRPGGRRGQ